MSYEWEECYNFMYGKLRKLKSFYFVDRLSFEGKFG